MGKIFFFIGYSCSQYVNEYKNVLDSEDYIMAVRIEGYNVEQYENDSYYQIDMCDIPNFLDTHSADNIIVVPCIDMNQELNAETVFNFVTFILIFIQHLYPEMLHRRRQKLWFIKLQEFKNDLLFDYSIINSAITKMAETIAVELEKREITVNCISVTKKYSADKLKYILDCLSECTLYMQMQTIII